MQQQGGREPYGIPNSRLWRVWCVDCGEPMRVCASDADKEHCCQECAPHRPPALAANLTPRQSSKLGRTSGG